MQRSTFYLLIVIITVLSLAVVVFFILFIKQRQNKKNALKQSKKFNEDYKEIKHRNKELLSANKSLTEKNDALKEAKDKAEKLAFTDYMTELPNQTAFIEMLNTVTLTLRNNEVIVIIGIDIDNFKSINDILGGTYGDQVLIDIANRLMDTIDENDFLARIGGDEFAIVSQNINRLEDYEEKIKKIQKIFNYPFLLAGREIFLTISMGITVVPRDGRNTHVLLKNINSAIYAAKSEGKNRYVHFSESINKKLTEKLEIQSDMRKALEEGQFHIYYQAQVDLQTSKIMGFEALIRWAHPQKGQLESSKFVPYAEETGLMIQIGKNMILESCKQMKEWHDKGYDNLKLSVNLSLRQFKDKDFVQTIIDIIEETNLDPAFLELEITERTALDDLSYSIETMEALRLIGISFSLDDFGTGYSSINYLKVLPLNTLKIDKSFIDSIMSDNVDKRITEAFIKLAQDLNMVVIAEGVELMEQEKFLKTINCNIAQGYLYSKPVPSDEAERIIVKESIM